MPPQVLTTRKAASKSRQELRAVVRFAAQKDLYTLASAASLCGYTEMTRSFHDHMIRAWETSTARKFLTLVPRGHFKTSVGTVAGAIRRLLRNPEIRILVASNKAENAEAMLTEIKGHLQNPILIDAFPDVLWPDPSRQAEQWTRSTITVKRKRRSGVGTIETIGVEGEITSKHYDHIIYDDIVGLQNSQTKEQLRSTIQWWRTSQDLLDPGATQDIIGTPWAFGDLYAWLIDQKLKHGMRLDIYRQPCWATTHQGQLRIDARGGYVPDDFLRDAEGRLVPAFPERFPYEVLMEIKADVGSAQWAAQHLIMPTDEETAVFPRSRARVVPRSAVPPPERLWTVMAIDPAASENAWSDDTAIAVGGFDAEGRLWILDLMAGQWDEDEVVRRTYEAWGRTPGIRVIGFEAISFAKLYRREFTRAGEQRGVYLPVMRLERDTKTAKNTRIGGLQPLWEAQEILLVEDIQALDDFLDQAERWRRWRKSQPDDMLDALADLLQLRVRPSDGGRPRSEVLLDDPELLARQEFEDRVMADRAARGLPPLDWTSMRAAYAMRQRRERMDEERGMLVGAGSAMGEFWG